MPVDLPAELAASKAAVRSALLTARRERTADQLADASRRIVVHLSDLVRTTQPAVIAAYEPFGTEPGVHLDGSLPAVLATTGGAPRVLLPVLMSDNDLDWRDWTDPGGRLGPAAIAEADLIVVPAVAVDRTGTRLGRGGGSYDRALARVPAGTPIVALLHDGELVHSLPAQPHDRRVTAVVTPLGGMIPLPR
ncbi:MAG: 5-formyltetrahydrofolate cyclo-ligase [Hamadaea sp.]|uniref:5-formyltetrahydrofolate cyclo-ligase n=1 Tax=Hamadaea sp. TaxID=2024425 RepID=UPI00182DB7BB|nr:5-formyltetrahydrofolate cyclo-ligase [Hamadaea sp.]NUR70303.1 5-formyltetrahydrofolate cyclo-ligase [Hamadaea sp.]NUT21468.1 5-formyltetrahydrofolate cyclo-ligase [Hamadaea sp.]